MQYCPKCRVKIRGEKKMCPLCRGDLQGESEKGPFPVISPGISPISVAKLITFIAAVIVVAMLCVYYFTRMGWALLVIPLCVVAWLDTFIALYYRYNLIRLVTVETYIGMLICFIVDKSLGFRGWSVKWAIPAAFTGLFIATFLMARFRGLRLEDCIIYLIFDVLMSLLQLIGVLNGANTFPMPAIISAAAMFLAGIGLFLFRFRDLKSASGKWFNV